MSGNILFGEIIHMISIVPIVNKMIDIHGEEFY